MADDRSTSCRAPRPCHAGGRPIGKIVEGQSLELAFLAWPLGIGAP